MNKLTRAVRYGCNDFGALTVALVPDYDGKSRLDAFPSTIRTLPAVRMTLFLTPEDCDKLWTARAVSDVMGEAVLDDIRCVRATMEIARHEHRGHPFVSVALELWGLDASQYQPPPPWTREIAEAIADNDAAPLSDVEQHHRAVELILEMNGPEAVRAYASQHALSMGTCSCCGPAPTAESYCLLCMTPLREAEYSR